MLAASLERIVEILSSRDGGADLERARLAFFARTGEFEPGEPWYETRIQCFFDRYVCELADPALASALPDEGEPPLGEIYRRCRRSSRGLFRVALVEEGRATLDELLGGGRFRVPAEHPLHPGEVLDGRLVAIGDTIHLAPGIVFHPPEAHEAIEAITQRVREAADFDREDVLDGLLRMRMRLDRFTSIRAAHVYRFEALGDGDILSAAWAKRG